MRGREDGREAEGYCGGERGGGVAAEEAGDGFDALYGGCLTYTEWMNRVLDGQVDVGTNAWYGVCLDVHMHTRGSV